jgi:hypothetical protein
VATLAAVRAGLRTTLEDRVDVNGYDTVPSSPLLPAVVVMPRSAEFEVGLGEGVDDLWLFDLVVLCSAGVGELGQEALDEFITGAGPRSIRQALHQSYRGGRPPYQIGLPNTKARLRGWGGYGLRHPSAEIDHISALGLVEVRTSAEV